MWPRRKNSIVSYKFAPVDPLTFVFPTDRGWLYIVSFTNRSPNFGGNAILENSHLSFEIAFDRSELDKPKKGSDPLVSITIRTILQKQLESMGELPIYYFVCEMNDRKEAGRARLFTEWFESDGIAGWDLFNLEMLDPQEQGLSYYVGLLIHEGHPNYTSIPDAFTKFLEEDITNGKFIRRR
jgi:Family of unknown function (DUF6169)